MLPFAEVTGKEVLWWLDLIATVLSFVGSLWMVVCCLRAPSPKSLSLKLIAAVGIADFLYSIANLLSNFQVSGTSGSDEDDLCSLEAILRQVSYTLSIFFSTCIAVASYLSMSPIKRFNRSLFFMSTVVLGIVISYVYIYIVPGIFGHNIVISKGPFYCWFTYSTKATTLMSTRLSIIITFQGLPVLIGLIIALLSYALAIKKMKEISRGFLEAYNINVYQVLWYPGILFVTFVPTVVDTVMRVYVEERPVWINALHLLLTHSIGFNNAVVYGIQTKFYKTNYEEYDSKKGSVDVEEEASYERFENTGSGRRSTVSSFLQQAYSSSLG